MHVHYAPVHGTRCSRTALVQAEIQSEFETCHCWVKGLLDLVPPQNPKSGALRVGLVFLDVVTILKGCGGCEVKLEQRCRGRKNSKVLFIIRMLLTKVLGVWLSRSECCTQTRSLLAGQIFYGFRSLLAGQIFCGYGCYCTSNTFDSHGYSFCWYHLKQTEFIPAVCLF